MKTPIKSIPAGGTITAIEPLKRDPNYRRVVVGRRTAAVLRGAVVESLGLRAGAAWTQRLADQVRRLAAVEAARRDALKRIARRAVSRTSLIERLIRSGHDEPAANEAVEELIADGWLDDSRLADTLLHEMTRRGPISRQLAAARLEAKGIDPSLARQLACKAAGPDTLAAAMQVARRSVKTHSAGGSQAIRRVATALTRRGFDHDTIEAALDRLGLRCDD